MIDRIRNKAQYSQVMEMVEQYIRKATESGGFHSLDKKDTLELKKLTLLAEKYEDDVLKIMPLPVTINAMVQVKMNEMGINQAKLAEVLGLGTSKLSQILNGKRDPDVSFLKAVHVKLGISGDFLLEHV